VEHGGLQFGVFLWAGRGAAFVEQHDGRHPGQEVHRPEGGHSADLEGAPAPRRSTGSRARHERHRTYEKTLLNQTNFDAALPEHIRNQAKLAVKDEYTFDFLELADEHSERQLEQAILAKVEPFLLEMGGMFSFIGSQFRLEIGGNEYFIDLLLFHRRLRLLVAVDLKIGEFQPEHIGKMQFYLAVLDDTVRMEGENPSIGILICKSKNKTIVEYALKESSKPIGVGTYKVVSSVPDELREDLPAPEQIARLLSD
jgi:predicted nuclease of restriction endonuclease-like (RecB) superfamily